LAYRESCPGEARGEQHHGASICWSPLFSAHRHKNINHFAILTDRTPKLVLLALDLYKYFINQVCQYRQDDS
jgi:hypothetical protein